MTWSTPTERQIKDILARRIEVEGDGVGLVVGVVDASGPSVVSHGVFDLDSQRPVDGQTVFEIGSNTKVFTALLLADMSARGEVSLDMPVADLLPAGVTPSRGGSSITLADLATHTSGLPRDADNYASKNRLNPFAGYTVERLYDFIGRQEIPENRPARPSYSNIGMGLLGHALALRAGVDFETLLRARILAPLGMASTGITVPPGLQNRFAIGHDIEKHPVPRIDIPVIAGAGALWSTAEDQLRFLAAELGHVEASLSSAIATQFSVKVETQGDFQTQALGWGLSNEDGRAVAWHVGRTSGFRNFMGLSQDLGVGVVVLGNMASRRAGEDIGLHLLTGRPIAPPARPVDALLSAEALQTYEGRYQLEPGRVITVGVDAGRLTFDPPGRRYVFHPAEGHTFYLKQFDVEVRFEAEGTERANVLHIRQNGRVLRAVRVDG